ncbi:hypothetical protein ACMXYR_02770 [Neptuniibacter sp. QD29_5]|uniref:hypothetical protein n=1 Tax=Neptuniibacter sp. QD29_5 TaxID=3398207 RepID=UPI0039F5697D
MGKWIKQRERTFPMHGIRRALWWRKDLYREWFNYAKLSGKYPKQFGNLDNCEFEEWWKTKGLGFDLFCEPYTEDYAKTIKASEAEDKQRHVLLEVYLNDDIDHLLQLVKRELKKKKPKAPEKSQAQFVPSKSAKHMRLYIDDVRKTKKSDMDMRLAHPRKIYEMTQQGMSNLDIAFAMGYLDYKDNNGNLKHKGKDVYEWKKAITGKRGEVRDLENNEEYGTIIESAFRRIARDRKRCKDMFANIAKGTFP